MSLFALDDDALIDVAARHATPLFVYSEAAARARWRLLRDAMPGRVRIAFAVKANPDPRLLEILAEEGAGFDCASIGELDRVAALPPSPTRRVWFAGPGKRLPELARALELGVRVQAEGFEDLARLDELADGPLEVNLRVHPAADVGESNRIIGGSGPSAFGIDEEDLDAVLERASTLRHVRIRGLHVFAASNERSADRLLATHAMVLALGRRLQDALGHPLQQIDLGGGLGVPYAPAHEPLDVARLGRGLAALLDASPWFTGELVLEPGRFLAAPIGVYLARLIREKRSRGTRFLVLEGGVNHLLRPHLTGEPFPVRAPGATGPLERATLAGPLCTSLDRLGEADLPALTPGALLAFGTTGAYGFTEGMTHFLSHPVPEQVWAS